MIPSLNEYDLKQVEAAYRVDTFIFAVIFAFLFVNQF